MSKRARPSSDAPQDRIEAAKALVAEAERLKAKMAAAKACVQKHDTPINRFLLSGLEEEWKKLCKGEDADAEESRVAFRKRLEDAYEYDLKSTQSVEDGGVSFEFSLGACKDYGDAFIAGARHSEIVKFLEETCEKSGKKIDAMDVFYSKGRKSLEVIVWFSVK